MKIRGRGGHRGVQVNQRSHPKAERNRARQEEVRKAAAVLKSVKHAREKKPRERRGPEGKVLWVDDDRVSLKLPHQRRPVSLHVLDVEPVHPA